MTRVKICGLSTPEAVAAAVDAGADYIGFVFATSKRQVTLNEANILAQAIPQSVQKVGVFVSPSLDYLLEAISTVPLDLVQIHGDWDSRDKAKIGVPVIRAIQISEGEPVQALPADYLLFDAPVAGSGKTFNWSALETDGLAQPFFIAGGLTEDNVAEAIERFKPYAVDVSSGVETDGKKDIGKIKRFIKGVKHDLSTTR